MILGFILKKVIFFPIKAEAIRYVPSSILSNITSWFTLLNFWTPIIKIFLVPTKLILHPNFFKKNIISTISGSIAQLVIIVLPLALTAARIAFSVAPTEIEGKLIVFPFSPFSAVAYM